jgi:UDP-N-acetylglucosamine acyltransferase
MSAPNIHPTAVVDPSAKLHPTVKVGPYAVIGEDVEIGEGTVISAHCQVEFARIGKNNKIFGGAYIGLAPQDLKYAGEKTHLIMGDNNLIRECVTLNRGTTATNETRLGNNCLVMAYTHVAHDCRVGNNVILVNNATLAGHVEIGDYAVLGGMTAVHQFTRIGAFVMTGGGSMVGKDVPPFCTAQGDRATLRGLNVVGLRRSGLPRPTISAIRDMYKTLFMRGMSIESAIAELKTAEQPKEALMMLKFVEDALASKRGVMRPATGAQAEEEALAQ